MGLFAYDRLKRALDVGIASSALVGLAIPLAATALAIRSTSKGPAIHWSRRIGKGNREFLMPKFRTMRVDTPQLATHLLTSADHHITPLGRLLRRTSIDELPQLFSVLSGDMSLVGPRPALFNQDDLVNLRTRYGVHELLPGMTGWAQVNGRDDLPIDKKVAYDAEYLDRRSIAFDLCIMFRTLTQVVTTRGVKH